MWLVVHLVGRAAHRFVVPTFFWTCKRFSPAFAGVAMVGQKVGAWLVWECGLAKDWPMAGLVVLMLVFYSGLLALVAVKWWNDTWGEFCDSVWSYVE